MSMLRKCRSLKLKLFSLIIVNKEYYNLLNFEDPEVKYLWIDSYCHPFYPVNTFHENKWAFDCNINNENVMLDSLSAYAVFKFLVDSNFIYSLEEIKIIWTSAIDSFEKDFNNLLSEFKRTESKTIKLKINWIHHNLPNFQINNLERTLKYYECGSYNGLVYKRLREIVDNNRAADKINSKEVDDAIHKWMIEERMYTDKIHSFLKTVLCNYNINYIFNLRRYINEWYHLAYFDSVEGNIYDGVFTLFAVKFDFIGNIAEE